MVFFTMLLNWKTNLLLCILFHYTVNHACYTARKPAVVLNSTPRRSLSHTWQYVVSKVFHITGDNVSFVCNVTEAVPSCQLLIHWNVTFLKNLQEFHSRHLVIGYLVRHSGKMNCMNYLTFCNFRLQLCISCICLLVVFCLSVCLCLSAVWWTNKDC